MEGYLASALSILVTVSMGFIFDWPGVFLESA
jgi:hypothetical protein